MLIALGTAVFVKILWVGIEIFYLPSQHVRLQGNSSKRKTLTYNIHIVSNHTLKKTIPKAPPTNTTPLKGYILEATYLDRERHLAVVKIKNRSLVLREGDHLQGGYVLKKVEEEKVIFEKDGHYYQLMMKRKKPHGFLSPQLIHPSSGTPFYTLRRQARGLPALGLLSIRSRMRYHYEI